MCVCVCVCVVWLFYPCQSLREGEGNIHSGAPPPWLVDDDSGGGGSEGKRVSAPVMIGPSEEEFLRRSKGHSDLELCHTHKYTCLPLHTKHTHC